MRKAGLRLASLAVAAIAVTVPAAATGTAAGTTHYTAAFKSPNGLPANVDKLVAAAAWTITERLPEIGGIGVESPDRASPPSRRMPRSSRPTSPPRRS